MLSSVKFVYVGNGIGSCSRVVEAVLVVLVVLVVCLSKGPQHEESKENKIPTTLSQEPQVHSLDSQTMAEIESAIESCFSEAKSASNNQQSP